MRVGLGLGLLAGGARGAFYPLTYGTPVAIFRADKGITLNGGKVSAWADQSGNGNHLTQPTAANQPTFTASWTNGVPGVTFVRASPTWLLTSAFTGGALASSTIVIVCSADQATDQLVFDGITGTNRNEMEFVVTTDSTIYAGAAVSDAIGPLQVPTQRVGIYNGASSSFWTRGVSRVSGASGGQTLTGITLGGRFDLATFMFNATVGAIYVYSGVLSNANVAALYAQDQAYFGAAI